MRAIYSAMYAQSGCFADTFCQKLSPQQQRWCRAWAEMESSNPWAKRIKIVKFGFYKNTFLRNLGQFWTV
jgi:hypothetical protein